jgi:PPK2 family polyphosphate:nucleotide phosphotransferase
MAIHAAAVAWRIAPGTALSLADIDPGSLPGAPGGETATRAASDDLRERLRDLQDRLWAECSQALLLVLQAMDAGGKDGTIRRALSCVNPRGLRVHGFKVPTNEERRHDFLWRVHPRCPAHGEIAAFNRSHYEDVIVPRVHDEIASDAWTDRCAQIVAFEHTLHAARTRPVKLFLHISRDEQARRLRARLEDPRKHWKWNPRDLQERARWDAYQAAYGDALAATSTDEAPWHVIPADHKWYRDWAVLTIVVGVLEEMDPQYPPAPEDADGVVIT